MLFFRIVSSFVIAVLLLSGCAPTARTPEPVIAPMERQEPTSIVIDLRTATPTSTPGPTATPLPPTDTPTPDPGADDPDEYYGGLVITLEEVGQTLTMRPKGAFLLRLGQEYAWNVTVEPPDVITLNKKILLESGEQGVFIGRKRGKATLRAVGDPICRQTEPPCARPSVLFIFKIIVE